MKEPSMNEPSMNELLDWAAEQRRLYHLGKLTSLQIHKLEEVPGWTWEEAPPRRNA
jgi:hypothetical protein